MLVNFSLNVSSFSFFFFLVSEINSDIKSTRIRSSQTLKLKNKKNYWSRSQGGGGGGDGGGYKKNQWMVKVNEIIM